MVLAPHRVHPRLARWLRDIAADVPSGPVYAFTDVAETRLGRIALSSLPAPKTTLSGFRLLPEGEIAFNARIALARRADKSLDVQYYLIQDDDLGRQLLRELRDAALRGVRVRLLVNDLYTAGEDDLLTGLAAYSNVDGRLFNPLPSRAGSFSQRLLSSMNQFGRTNHRMHNKLFIADNSSLNWEASSSCRRLSRHRDSIDAKPSAQYCETQVAIADVEFPGACRGQGATIPPA
jgi:putative cardiolipin synthase